MQGILIRKLVKTLCLAYLYHCEKWQQVNSIEINHHYCYLLYRPVLWPWRLVQT